jgi:hypothetical protein
MVRQTLSNMPLTKRQGGFWYDMSAARPQADPASPIV